MKLAVLADIHANLVALQSVMDDLEAWRPDVVIVAGDTVNRGPRPVECLRLVQDKQRTQGWFVLRGNHEDYVIKHAQPDAPRSGLAFEVHRSAYWTYQQLNSDTSDLEAMPFEHRLNGPDGNEICVTHASMLGNRQGIYPEMSDEEFQQRIRPSSSLFCVGHTHRPLIRQIDGTLVVNVGAVGLPFDGDPRPSYARLTWQHHRWHADIIRLDYDRQQAEHDFFETGFMDESGALASLILDELRTAESRLFQWAEAYQDRVLMGEMTMEDSAREFMAKLKAR